MGLKSPLKITLHVALVDFHNQFGNNVGSCGKIDRSKGVTNGGITPLGLNGMVPQDSISRTLLKISRSHGIDRSADSEAPSRPATSLLREYWGKTDCIETASVLFGIHRSMKQGGAALSRKRPTSAFVLLDDRHECDAEDNDDRAYDEFGRYRL